MSDNSFLLIAVLAVDLFMGIGLVSTLEFYKDIKEDLAFRLLNTVILAIIATLLCCSLILTGTLVGKILFTG